MRRLIMIRIICDLCLLILTIVIGALTGQAATKPQTPPASQPLVREGDLSVSLVEALKFGLTDNETDSENLLVAAGWQTPMMVVTGRSVRDVR